MATFDSCGVCLKGKVIGFEQIIRGAETLKASSNRAEVSNCFLPKDRRFAKIRATLYTALLTSGSEPLATRESICSARSPTDIDRAAERVTAGFAKETP